MIGAASSDLVRLRVALVLPYNPLIERTGLQNLAVRWGRGLAKTGQVPTIVTLGPSGTVEGTPVRGHHCFAGLAWTLLTGGWDVIHWLEVWPDRWVAAQHTLSWLIRSASRARLILTTETPGNLNNRGGARLFDPLIRAAYARFVVPSADFLEEYGERGIGPDRVAVVPHGLLADEPFRAVDSRELPGLRHRLGLLPDLPTVLYIGRLVERKRPLDFIAAVRLLAAEGLRFQALLVGDSLLHEDSIDAEVTTAVRASSDVVAHRPMTDRPWDYMAASDIVAVPSTRDGQAFVVLESMACGAVPVVSDIPVLRTTLSTDGTDEVGSLVPACDVAALAGAIGELLRDPVRRGRMRANALAWMAHGRSLERLMPALLAAYGRPVDGGA